MAMDFFESQDVARRRTGRLVVLFILAVLAIMAATYLAVGGGLALVESTIALEPEAPRPGIGAHAHHGATSNVIALVAQRAVEEPQDYVPTFLGAQVRTFLASVSASAFRSCSFSRTPPRS